MTVQELAENCMEGFPLGVRGSRMEELGGYIKNIKYAIESYAAQQTADKDTRIAELEARIKELEVDLEKPRLSCGCPELNDFLNPCPGHVFSHWHQNKLNALRMDRFCFYCGEMETQELKDE